MRGCMARINAAAWRPLLAFAAKAQATTVPAQPSMDAAGTSISMGQAGNGSTGMRALPPAAATPQR